MDRERRATGFVPIALVVIVLSAIGTYLSWAAYASDESSGLQYLFLYIGAGLAAIAGACMLVLCISRVLPWICLLAPALAVVLGMAPMLSGVGYNGSVIDRPGQIAGMMVLVLHAAVAGYGVRWIRRAEAAAARGPEAQPG